MDDHVLPLDQPVDRPLHRRWWVPLGLLGLGVCALAIDLPVSAYCHGGNAPGLVRQIVESGETFGHAMGVLFVLSAIAVLDPDRRKLLPRLATCSWIGGLVANVVKMSIARTRPHRFDLESTTDALATFDRWLPLWTSGHGDRSFPSAHTTSAFGLAIGLAAVYPRGRVFFVVLAAACGLQRVECGAHYVSDVFCGAALGWAWASLCLERSPLARFFDSLEAVPTDSEKEATVDLESPVREVDGEAA